MSPARARRRQGFNLKLPPATHQQLEALAQASESTMAGVIHDAIDTYAWLVRETRRGGTPVIRRGDLVTELHISGLPGGEQ